MQDCVGIDLAHFPPFSLDINNVKHELAKSVNSYCDPSSNLYLGLQKCVRWCQCGPMNLNFQRIIEIQRGLGSQDRQFGGWVVFD